MAEFLAEILRNTQNFGRNSEEKVGLWSLCAEVNGSSMVAAQDDSSDDEDDSKPEIKKPQDDLDDFLDDVSAQPGDYEAL